MRHLIDMPDLSVQEIEELMQTAMAIDRTPAAYADVCRGRRLATLFFEPSTRTRLSFEAAMLDLGGQVIGFSQAAASSAAKGESVADTARVVGCYADIIAIRSPWEGAAQVASMYAGIPVINAGDGGHAHPTQTLADLLTIRREKGRLEDLTVGLCGDLKYGRTVHSLLAALVRYPGLRVVLISPPALRLPDGIGKEVLEKNGVPYRESEGLEDELPGLDVLYMTRIQRERFDDPEEYLRYKDCYCLNADKMKAAKADMIVLHPLPRVNEISVQVDSDPRAAYFRQVKNGKLMRMALMVKLLAEQEAPDPRLAALPPVSKTHVCQNPHCICAVEQELPHRFLTGDAGLRCFYCEKSPAKGE